MEVNDIFELLTDADHHTIRLTNERSNNIYELNVDVMKCTLRWQLNLSLM